MTGCTRRERFPCPAALCSPPGLHTVHPYSLLHLLQQRLNLSLTPGGTCRRPFHMIICCSTPQFPLDFCIRSRPSSKQPPQFIARAAVCGDTPRRKKWQFIGDLQRVRSTRCRRLYTRDDGCQPSLQVSQGLSFLPLAWALRRHRGRRRPPSAAAPGPFRRVWALSIATARPPSWAARPSWSLAPPTALAFTPLVSVWTQIAFRNSFKRVI